MISYWWLQDDITPAARGEETGRLVQIQSYKRKSRKEEHDVKDQLQGPEDLQRCSREKEKEAEGTPFYFCISC